MDFNNKNSKIIIIGIVIILLFIFFTNRKDNFTSMNNCSECISSNAVELTTDTKFGRGVKATRNIYKGEVIEKCPTITEKDDLIKGRIRDYIFKRDSENASVAFGLCSMYNHSDDHDCSWRFEDDYLVIYAVKDIPKGKEIFTTYGSQYWIDREANNHLKKQ